METNSDKSSSSLLLELPEYVLVELLLKLPVESLIILRSACKLLYTHISSEYFSRLHLQRWGNRDKETKNVFLGEDFAPDDLQYALRGQNLCMKLARVGLNPRRPGNNCRFLFEEEFSTLQCGGCYDGILCFYEFHDDHYSHHLVIYICNPALNQCRLVLRPRDTMYDEGMTKVCFVHDPTSEDYKVIVVSVSHGYEIPKVHVYSLKDGFWTKMDTNKAGTVPSDVELCDPSPSMSDLVVQNGRVYWMSTHEGYNHDYNVLNVLDLQKQSVGEIALPDKLRDKTIYDGCFRLIRHQGSLGLCWEFPLQEINWRPVELCVMKEEENDGISWGEIVSVNLTFLCNSSYSCDIADGKPRGCFEGFTCKMPSATTSWGYLLMSDKNHPTDYVMGNVDISESLGTVFIPKSPYDSERREYAAIDYVPSLVSVMPAHEDLNKYKIFQKLIYVSIPHPRDL